MNIRTLKLTPKFNKKIIYTNMWNRFKAWFIKNWEKITNWIVLILVYGINTNVWIEVIVGLWIFAQIGYAGWKWFNKKDK